MKRLGFALALAGFCAVVGACDGTRGLTEPAGRLHNGGTMGSGHRDGADSLIVSTQNIGTSGSGLREGMAGESTVTTQNIGTIGSGHREGMGQDSTLTTQNIGTSGSGH